MIDVTAVRLALAPRVVEEFLDGVVVRADAGSVYVVTDNVLDKLPVGLLASRAAAAVILSTRGGVPEVPSGALVGFAANAAQLPVVAIAMEESLVAERGRADADRALSRARYELDEMLAIARAITQERDIDRLLALVLEKSRYVTGADAGSIYVAETTPSGEAHRLRFKLSQNDSIEFESKEFVVPVSMRSIAGASVMTRRPINLADVYDLPEDAPYGFDRRFDQRVKYRTRSMITVPMITAENEIIGAIQLINKKRNPSARLHDAADVEREVVEFDERSETLLASIASQAGIALETAMLYREIQDLFEGFVRASVHAIEQRDPTTSGHSQRVSVLSKTLAETLDRQTTGTFASVHFTKNELRELEYASLLHDFGKIGVREQVLIKAKKLYPHELELVRARLDYAMKDAEAAFYRLISVTGADREALEREYETRRTILDAAWKTVEASNEPTVMREGDFARVASLGDLHACDPRGDRLHILRGPEIDALSVTKGTLSDKELAEIRSHVVHTYNFLSQIPWGSQFSRIPEIAGAHHERLDGTGYPNQLSAQQIPLQSKIMSIADIFDALTARDRPYKRALSPDRALDILGHEVKEGHIDPELVEIFVGARVFAVVDGDLPP